MKKIISFLLIMLVASAILPTFVFAAANTYIKDGKFTYVTRYESTGFYAPCAKSGRVKGGHVNLEVWKKKTKLTNWHIGWDEQCLISHDSVSGKCERVCYEKKGKGKIGDTLKSLSISNSAIRAIESSKGALRDFDKLGLSKGSSPYLVYFSAIGAFIAAASVAIGYVIYKTISCYYAGCAA